MPIYNMQILVKLLSFCFVGLELSIGATTLRCCSALKRHRLTRSTSTSWAINSRCTQLAPRIKKIPLLCNPINNIASLDVVVHVWWTLLPVFVDRSFVDRYSKAVTTRFSIKVR
jgi:hypothetical protein